MMVYRMYYFVHLSIYIYIFHYKSIFYNYYSSCALVVGRYNIVGTPLARWSSWKSGNLEISKSAHNFFFGGETEAPFVRKVEIWKSAPNFFFGGETEAPALPPETPPSFQFLCSFFVRFQAISCLVLSPVVR